MVFIMIVLRQKEYARADYEGLTEKGRQSLREARLEAAKKLREDRKFYQGFKTEVRDRGYNMALNKAHSASNAEKIAQILAGESAPVSPKINLDSTSINNPGGKGTTNGFFKRNKKSLLIAGGVTTIGGSLATVAVKRRRRKNNQIENINV